jgi:hypothetical protein
VWPGSVHAAEGGDSEGVRGEGGRGGGGRAGRCRSVHFHFYAFTCLSRICTFRWDPADWAGVPWLYIVVAVP